MAHQRYASQNHSSLKGQVKFNHHQQGYRLWPLLQQREIGLTYHQHKLSQQISPRTEQAAIQPPLDIWERSKDHTWVGIREFSFENQGKTVSY
eukprot:11570997-Ditylum_brightwellii.AAC.1